MVGTNYLKTAIIDAFLDKLQNETNYVAVGTDDTTPSSSDTALGNEVLRKARQEYTRDDVNGEIIISMWIATTEANGYTLKEVGVFDANTGGNMFNHDLITPFEKTSDKELWIDVKFKLSLS